jgi:hypothetical protein
MTEIRTSSIDIAVFRVSDIWELDFVNDLSK